MSLDKAILHGKEHRKPYIGGKSIDRTCRNHGNEEVDEKVVLYIYVVANGYIRNNWLYIPKR